MMMSTFIHLKIQTVELPSSVRYYAGTDLLIYLGQFAQKGPQAESTMVPVFHEILLIQQEKINRQIFFRLWLLWC